MVQYLVGGGSGNLLSVENLVIEARGEHPASADTLPLATDTIVTLTVRADHGEDSSSKKLACKASASKALSKWIDQECSGDHKSILMQLATLESE